MAEDKKKYTHRFLARVIIEAATPLSVGSGENDVITDHLIVRDVNGLPYIPGSALAGIIRHAIEKEKACLFFGTDGANGEGSQIIFSSAQLVGKENCVIEGILPERDDFLANFDNLPVRQHVRMTDKGTAADRGKFDNEVVYKGTRFCFEMEMLSEGNNKDLFKDCLKKLVSGSFRIGSGTRSGYGECKVIECKEITLDLSKRTDMSQYLNKTSSLNDPFWKNINDSKDTLKANNREWTTYQISLKPDDFFLFGSGFGDDDADIKAVAEAYIQWDGNVPRLSEECILIPGSSVKGALSHRVAYHYNKINQWFVGNENARIGDENQAVRDLFGYTQGDKAQRGNVIISDVIRNEMTADKKKILNHVAIDRFTGGSIDGALFSEEVVYGGGMDSFVLSIIVNNEAFENGKVKEAFETTLDDIVTGMLPLGGGTNRGHGCFNGTWKIKEEIK